MTIILDFLFNRNNPEPGFPRSVSFKENFELPKKHEESDIILAIESKITEVQTRSELIGLQPVYAVWTNSSEILS